MSLIAVVVFSSAVLLAGYLAYGRFLGRFFRVDPAAPTPAHDLCDGSDYIPTDPKYLITQHFSAISAAGPIVGPILAGAMFGWAPALIWILAGSILIGGVHDLGALLASVRHKARSIAEVVREHVSRQSYILFLAFVWIAIVYIIVAFTDIVAGSFVGVQKLEDGTEITGGAIASSSMLYLALPVIMALLMRYAKLNLYIATAIFLPLIGVAIWIGRYIPFDLAGILSVPEPVALRIWDVILLGYCFVASIVPMWIQLQPRGHLGGFFLFFALGGGLLGLVLGGEPVRYPAFKGFSVEGGASLFPLLFITIACAACSGFHSLVASGTTSKQLRRETDAVPIGYGGMLLEALVGVVSLACVMMLASDSGVLAGGVKPNYIYGLGIGKFLNAFGIPAAFGVSFGLLAFTTFVYDTLDVATRLGRYILQELLGMKGTAGKLLATAATAGLPAVFVMQKMQDAKGNPIPAWKVFWNLFGASNQLLAALTLIGITVWMWKKHGTRWAFAITGLPAAFMYVMSFWALVDFLRTGSWANPVTWVAAVLVVLAALLAIDAARAVLFPGASAAPNAGLPAAGACPPDRRA